MRLLTLTGPGGVGKTRLSLAVAARLSRAFADGVCFVPLAPITDPALVLPTIAQALGVREHSDQPIVAALQRALRDRQLLVLLDNVEQVLDAAVQLADLLQAAPALKLLVTSRAPLQLAGEQQFAVPPLLLPDAARGNAVEQVEQSEAGALFIAHAQAVNHDFAVTPANAALIAALCARLDGLPLAIVLAAARTKVLSLAVLLQRLEQRLPLLTGGSRNLPVRHQTIRAAIDGSYELLPAAEQRCFRQVGVFVGSFTLTAAEAVCGDAGAEPLSRSLGHADSLAIIDRLQVLVEHSLVQYVEHEVAQGASRDATACWSSSASLPSSSSWLTARRRCSSAATWTTLWVWLRRQLVRCSRETEPLARFQQLEREHDNLRAALRWALDAREAALALRLSTALARFWHARGYRTEGRRWLDAALAAAAQDSVGLAPLRAEALHMAGVLAGSQSDRHHADALFGESLALFHDLGDTAGVAAVLNSRAWNVWAQGDLDGAAALAEEQLSLERARGNQRGIANALLTLGWIAHDQGRFAQAFALLEENLALRRAMGDTGGVAEALYALGVTAYHQGDFARAAWWTEDSLSVAQTLGDLGLLAHVLTNLGGIAAYQGAWERAARLLDEALVLKQKLGEPGSIAVTLRYQGNLAEVQQDWTRAALRYRESLALSWEVQSWWEVAACLERLAGVADGRNEAEHAARLWGAAEALRERLGAPLPPADRTWYTAAVAHTRAALGAGALDTAWVEGRTMPLEQVIADALEDQPANLTPEGRIGEASSALGRTCRDRRAAGAPTKRVHLHSRRDRAAVIARCARSSGAHHRPSAAPSPARRAAPRCCAARPPPPPLPAAHFPAVRAAAPPPASSPAAPRPPSPTAPSLSHRAPPAGCQTPPAGRTWPPRSSPRARDRPERPAHPAADGTSRPCTIARRDRPRHRGRTRAAFLRCVSDSAGAPGAGLALRS